MNKKVFTLLLLAVFMLAQFSVTSAAPTVGATITVDPIPTFSAVNVVGTLDFTMTLPGDPVQNVLAYWRVAGNPWNADDCVDIAGDLNGLTAAAGSYGYGTGGLSDQNVFEMYILLINVDDIVEDSGNGAWDDDCEAHVAGMNNAPAAVAHASTFIDDENPDFFMANPPSVDAVNDFDSIPVSCNTFEMWALASDSDNLASDEGFSGFDAWNTFITGTFAVPAPEGPETSLLSWFFSFPSTANGAWEMSTEPTDVVGNTYGQYYFRDGNAPVDVVDADELEDCVDFTDTAGHANELYVRYLADLGLIAGNPDGSYGPDNTLTRAEAAALFEKANGYDDTMLPPTAPVGCEFTDVSASDWFAGWVWQACDDGFMNGVGGGLFDPSNLLTRGQVVTIFNNIAVNGTGALGSFLDDNTTFDTVLNYEWGWILRESAWTDVNIGDYFAQPLINAYGVGVVEGTTATTFSPNQPATRGEFAMWLYRALSRAD